MPRSGWLALGGVLAASGIPALAAGREIAITAALTSVALLLIWFGRRSRAGAVAAAIAVGAVMVALRMSVAPADRVDLVPPSGRGPWEMVVQTVGSPREGMQVATLQLVPSQATGGGVRLAATLPRYPPIEPGDVVQVGGRLRERPDSAYGQYLERIGAWGTLQADSLEVAPTPDGPARRLEGWRRDSGDALAAVLPEPEADWPPGS